jgi:hypothetical protein
MPETSLLQSLVAALRGKDCVSIRPAKLRFCLSTPYTSIHSLAPVSFQRQVVYAVVL